MEGKGLQFECCGSVEGKEEGVEVVNLDICIRLDLSIFFV